MLGRARTNVQAVDYGLAKAVLTIALKKLIAAEPDVTKYDTIVGDGDCGIGLQRGAEGMCIVALVKFH